MATATTQAKRIRAEAKAKAQAEAKVAEELAKSERRAAKKAGEAPCTAEQIVYERDTRGLSWVQVAVNLNLGSAGSARTWYTKLTGKPHYESQMTGKRASKGSVGRKVEAPGWTNESDQDEIIERLRCGEAHWHPPTKDSRGYFEGARITVECDFRGLKWQEELDVARVMEFRYEGDEENLVVMLIDRATGGTRCFRVADIVEVR